MAIERGPRLGSQELLKDFTSKQPLQGTFFYLQFLKQVTEDMVDSLRVYFSTNPRVPSFFRWVGKVANDHGQETDIMATKVHIAAGAPDNESFYPSVLVDDVQAKLRDLFLNHQNRVPLMIDNPLFDPKKPIDDQIEPPELEVGFSANGKLDYTAIIKIRGNHPVECDQVTDFVIHGLLGPVMRDMEHRNYNFYPDRTGVSQRGVENYTNKAPVYVRTINLDMMGHWEDQFMYNDPNVTDVTVAPSPEGPETL
jgi:hypothetical protein